MSDTSPIGPPTPPAAAGRPFLGRADAILPGGIAKRKGECPAAPAAHRRGAPA